MIEPALQEKPEPDGEEARQPKVAVALDLAEKDGRSLFAILEGRLGTDIDFEKEWNHQVRTVPDGVQLFTFDPSSQTLTNVSYQSLEDAVNIKIEKLNEEAANVRKLLSRGANLDILINSEGGKIKVEDMFERVTQLIATYGGKVSSYGTARVQSAAALIWGDAQERYMLPFSMAIWHTLVLNYKGKQGSVTRFNMEAKRILRKKNLTEQEHSVLSAIVEGVEKCYNTVTARFCRFISQILDTKVREELLNKFYADENVVISGYVIGEWGLATLSPDIESMKKAFYKSIGAEPYCAELGPIQGFWSRAEADYETIKDRLSKERKEGAREKTRADIPPTKKEEAPYQQPEAQGNRHVRKSPQRRSRHVVSTVSYAAVIALMVGTGYMTMRYVNSWRERNDRIMQPLVEDICSRYDWVSLHTGTQKVDYKRKDGTVVEAEIGRNLYGTKLVSIPSMGYRKDCL